jgi:hypothetical protein
MKGNSMAIKTREEVLEIYGEIDAHIPVDWDDKESTKAFSKAIDYYAKTWGKLSMEDQGWVCEQLNMRVTEVEVNV